MNDRSQTIVASVLEFAVGVWLLISPLFFTVSGAALVNVLIVGGVIAVAGLAQLVWTNILPSWVGALAAIWLAISAFVLSVDAGFAWNIALSAIAVFILSVWDGIEVTHLHDSGHKANV